MGINCYFAAFGKYLVVCQNINPRKKVVRKVVQKPGLEK